MQFILLGQSTCKKIITLVLLSIKYISINNEVSETILK